MKMLLTGASVAALLVLAACGPEPEEVVVAEVEPAVVVDPVGTTGVTTWDTNADGMFQEAEYTAWRDQGVGAWDTNADTRLDRQEFSTGWTNAGFNGADDVFVAWDDNNDGFLADDEFFDDEEWDEWDANDDGMLEAGEFTYY